MNIKKSGLEINKALGKKKMKIISLLQERG